MKHKDKVEFALKSLATIQVIFEWYFRMSETRDAEVFATEVDCMFDVAGVINGHDGEKRLPELVEEIRKAVVNDPSRITAHRPREEEG